MALARRLPDASARRCAAAYAGRARTAAAIFDQLVGDLVAHQERIERAKGRVGTMEEYFAVILVADEPMALAGVQPGDDAARRTAGGRKRLVGLARKSGDR